MVHKTLKLRHRVLVEASTRYQRADQAWRHGLATAEQFIPEAVGRGYWAIGNPGSRVRRLYDERDNALRRLNVAIAKLKAGRARREQAEAQKPVLLIEAR